MSDTTSFFSKLRGMAPGAYVGLAMLLLFLFMAVLGPVIAPYPIDVHTDKLFAPPSSTHWLGTDQHGVDTLSQILHGAREALKISGIVVFLCASIGTFLGSAAGYFRGAVDEVIMRIVDILLAFPGILLNIAVVALIAKPGIGTLIIALCINGWVGYARLVRGQVLSLSTLDYVAAAQSYGSSSFRVLWKHILPNILSPIMVMMSLGFGGVILVEASLSFLGLGPQLSYTWGALLEQGTTFLYVTPRLAIVPGLAIMLVVLGSNLFGDGLRDKFDPKSKER